MKSSKKPNKPNITEHKIINNMYLFCKSQQSRILVIEVKNITIPPAVGVPFFSICEAGPHPLIGWPIEFSFSFLINKGINTNVRRRAIAKDKDILKNIEFRIEKKFI